MQRTCISLFRHIIQVNYQFQLGVSGFEANALCLSIYLDQWEGRGISATRGCSLLLDVLALLRQLVFLYLHV